MKNNALCIGQIEVPASKLKSALTLFDSSVTSRRAVHNFLRSLQRKHPPHNIILPNATHTLICAPTGVGKGVSFVLPFLLNCDESCIVVDYKGENAAKTMLARRRMGHKCIIIDPFKTIADPPDTFNPIGGISPDSETALDEIRDIAEAIVIRTGQEKDPYWLDAAQLWITGMIAAVVAFADPIDRNLQSVRALLTSTERMQTVIDMMCQSDKWSGMLSRNGSQLKQAEGKEKASILTSTNRFLNFLDTIAVAESTKSSNWNPRELLTGKVTVYLVLPPAHQRSQAPLLRLWISSLMRTVVNGGLSNRKIHFVLDEAASLGPNMSCLEDGVDKYRAYGVRCQFYYQSLGQLKTCWPEGREQTLLSNVTKVFFGINDYPTAELVSNMLGDQTLIINSGGTSSSRSSQGSKDGGSTSHSVSTNDNWQQTGKKLLMPAEVMALDPSIAITFTPGVPPIATRLVRYFDKPPQRMGRMKILGDTLCLFISAVLLAVIFTGALLNTLQR